MQHVDINLRRRGVQHIVSKTPWDMLPPYALLRALFGGIFASIAAVESVLCDILCDAGYTGSI